MRSEFEARREIVEIGRRLWQRGYVASNDGNISARLDGRILVTPTGLSKGFLKPSDMVVVSPSGEKLSGDLDATSELPMHLAVYRARANVERGRPRASAEGDRLRGRRRAAGAVRAAGGHSHARRGAARGLRDTLDARKWPDRSASSSRSYNAILLSNHGVLTLGSDLSQAYFRMETVEHFAEITLAARALGGPSPLSNEDVRKLLSVRDKLGLTDVADCSDCGACDSAAGRNTGRRSSEECGPG